MCSQFGKQLATYYGRERKPKTEKGEVMKTRAEQVKAELEKGGVVEGAIKVYIPVNSLSRFDAIGFWKDAEGSLVRDYIQFRDGDFVSGSVLKDIQEGYRQDCIFVEIDGIGIIYNMGKCSIMEQQIVTSCKPSELNGIINTLINRFGGCTVLEHGNICTVYSFYNREV